MSQVSETLRRYTHGYFHWCPGCDHGHLLPDGWTFNGNVDKPTFSSSFAHEMGQGKRCHYILTDGVLNFCGDCSHALAGQSVPLPVLPPDLRDAEDTDGGPIGAARGLEEKL